jgi:multimeric flavodoxin WrbA
MVDGPVVRSLVVTSHSRTGSTARLAAAAVRGARAALAALDDGVDGTGHGEGVVRVVAVDVTETTLAHVLAADAVLFATPARFGGLAGLTRDLLERIYPWFDDVPDVRPGLPWTAIVKGATDPSGAVRDLERILTGLRWRQVLPPLQCTGDLSAADLAAAEELGATLAAGLATGVW